MEGLNWVWIIVGLVAVVVGPGGGFYVVMKGASKRIEEKFTTFVEQMRIDREETREWLKDLQTETSKNTTDIAVLEALQKEA